MDNDGFSTAACHIYKHEDFDAAAILMLQSKMGMKRKWKKRGLWAHGVD
jgi:hypothetical protein